MSTTLLELRKIFFDRSFTFEEQLEIAQKLSHTKPDLLFALADEFYTGKNGYQNMQIAFNLYCILAELDFEPAKFRLGCMHLAGHGTNKNYTKGIESLEEIATLEDSPVSVYALYILALEQMGKNDAQAELLFNQAKQHVYSFKLNYTAFIVELATLYNYPSELDKLGLFYEQGDDYIPVNYDKAFACFLKAAEQGYAPAQYNLSRLYLNGRGVEKNLDLAREWCQKAATQGHQGAILDLEKTQPVVKAEPIKNYKIALLRAVIRQDLVKINEILSHDQNINLDSYYDHTGYTLLMIAVNLAVNNPSAYPIVEALVKAGASISLKDIKGKFSALDLAKQHRSIQLCNLLEGRISTTPGPAAARNPEQPDLIDTLIPRQEYAQPIPRKPTKKYFLYFKGPNYLNKIKYAPKIDDSPAEPSTEIVSTAPIKQGLST